MAGRSDNRSGTNLKRCAVYVRKSTAAGLEMEFSSLDAQREACEAYIRAQHDSGWRLLPDRYEDGGFTGANLERPGFQRLMADIEAGRLDVVVVQKVDRLSRSLFDFAGVMDRFRNAGVAFVSVTQNFNTADAMGRMTLNMLMTFAEFEREMIAERTRDKIGAARRKGKWTGGTVPLGYDSIDKKLVVNEYEAMVAGEIFDLYEKHQSARTVAQTLNERGRTTKRHESRNGKVRPGHRWNKDSVLRALRCPIYAGLVRSGGKLFPAEHDAIIEKVQWERVQALLGEKSGEPTLRSRNPAYLLRGTLRCALCGHAMTPASTRKKRGKEFRYYRCVRREKGGNAACTARSLPAKAIEDFVVGWIREVTQKADFASDVQERLTEQIAERQRRLDTERHALPKEIARLSTEGRRLVEVLAQANGTTTRLVEERIEGIGNLIGKHERRLQEIGRDRADLDRISVEAGWVTEALQHFETVWDAMTLENRVRLVHAIVERVEVNEQTGEITGTLVDLGDGVVVEVAR